MTEEDSLLCQFCWHGSEMENVTGQLHSDEADSSRIISAHHRCMQYASGLTQYKCEEFGGFDVNEVEKEILRGSKLRCSICKGFKGKKSKGACCGCAVKWCRKTFHFPCAYQDQVTITKRLVVTANKNISKDKFVLYRVFCSKAHEQAFRKGLKDELRNKNGKKWQNSREDENHQEEGGGQEAEASVEDTVEDNDTSSADHNTTDISFGSLVTNTQLSPSTWTSGNVPLPPVLSSTPLVSSSKVEGAVKGTEETCLTDESISPVPLTSASHSSRQTKERRRSGLVQTKARGKARASQRPSCSLIEEMSNSGSKPGQTEEPCSPNRQVLVVPEVQSGVLENAAVVVHTLHTQESAENESPNIPRQSPRLQVDMAKSMNNCFVVLEDPGSKINLQRNGFLPVSSRPSQSSPQGSPLKAPQVGPFKVPQASPAKGKALQVGPSSSLQVSSPRSLQDGSVNTSQSSVATGPESSPADSYTLPTNGKSTAASPTKCAASPKGAGQCSLGSDPVRLCPEEASGVAPPSSPGRSSQNSAPGAQRTSPRKSMGDKTLLLNGPAEKDLSTESNSRSVPHQESSASLLLQTVQVRRGSPRHGGRGSDTSKPASGLDSGTKETDARPVTHTEAGGASSERSGRKRTGREVGVSRDEASPRTKTSKRSADRTDVSQDCVLLIPSDVEEFERLGSLVKEMASEALEVKEDSMHLWQHVTKQSPPSKFLLFFMLDLVKELESGNSETLLNLLFDGEHLGERLSNYIVQAQIFEKLSDEEAQKELRAAVWSGMERSVKKLPMAWVLRLRDQELVTLAVNVCLCKDGHKIRAFLQAYKGLFWWDKDTEADTFHLSSNRRRLAAECETLALQVWLTKLNPVTEVTVLPSDELLLDKARLVASTEFTTLVQHLKEKMQVGLAAMQVSEEAAAAGEGSLQACVPLLIFQPVDFVILNFQQYFRKACHEFLQTRGLMCVLALVPLSNLHNCSCKSISTLMKSEGDMDGSYSVEVCSAFCPDAQPTTLVLLEIQAHPQLFESTVMVTGMQSEQGTNGSATTKKKRGRPRKHRVDQPQL